MFLARASFLRWQNPDKCLIGINCFQPFGIGVDSAGTYTATPFTNGGADTSIMSDTRLTAWRSQGFDFVRMCIDPAVLLAAVDDTALDARIAEIMTGIGRRTGLGLKVIVVMMFTGGYSPVSGWLYTDVLDGLGGTKFTRLKYVAARLATAIHAATRTTCKPSEVCFELFNEPPTSGAIATATYISHIEAYWTAVRAALPLHTIVVAGNNFNAIDGLPAGGAAGSTVSGLTALTPANFDANTTFAFHPYESILFTHQGQSGTSYQYCHELTFPAASHPGGQAAAEAAFTTAAGGDSGAINECVTQTAWSTSLAKYWSVYGSKTLLALRMDVLEDWCGTHSISPKRLMNTENGVHFTHASNDATDASAGAYVQAMREIAQEAGINCYTIHEAQWNGNVAPFGIDNTSTGALNSAIKSGLGFA